MRHARPSYRRTARHVAPADVEDVRLSELVHFTDKQKEAYQSVKNSMFTFMGGAMGGGKSYWLRWSLVILLFKWFAKLGVVGARVGLFCEDYPALKDRHLSKIGTEFPDWLGAFHDDHKEHGCCFILSQDYGGGIIAFRNLDDASKYQSAEFAAIAVDELPKNPYSTFRMLRTRLRWPGIVETRFLGAGNPGGYPWVRAHWVDHNFPPEEQMRDQFSFVQVLPKDNPHLGDLYRQQLDSLPEDERRAFRDGDWTAFDETMDERGYMRLISDPELANSLCEKVRHFGMPVIGVDPAAGGDRSSIAFKSKLFQELVFCKKLNDTMALVPIIVDTWEVSGFQAPIVVDVTGIGRGLYDRLCEIEVDGHKMEVIGVGFGDKPISSNKERYYDLKADLYWRQRNWMLGGGKILRHMAVDEFGIVKYKIDSERRIRIQPKDELRKLGIPSPDGCDSLALTQYIEDGSDYDRIKASTPFRDRMIDVWRSG